jgi:hypothetical protein
MEQKQMLVQYLQKKVLVEDWHAVSDAANDIRELEVNIEWAEFIKGSVS